MQPWPFMLWSCWVPGAGTPGSVHSDYWAMWPVGVIQHEDRHVWPRKKKIHRMGLTFSPYCPINLSPHIGVGLETRKTALLEKLA
jgi:hypothetical protein